MNPLDIVNGVAQVATSVVNNVAEEKRAQAQRQWNEQMMDKQNQWSLDMWNKTNEYNSPAAQVQRMQDAGLNPLYYGLDGSSANGLESAQALGYERAQGAQFANPVQSVIDSQLKRAQIDNVNADTAKKNNENITETERRQNLIKERDEMDARIENYKSNSNLNDKMAAKADQYMEYADDIYQAQINRDNAAAGLSEAQMKRIQELLPGEKELQKMSIEDYAHKWRYWDAQIGHMAAQNAVLAKQCRYYLVSLLTSGVYGSGLSAVNGYIMNLIQEDSDLSPKEKDDLMQAFGLPDKKGKDKGNSDPRDYSQYDGSGWSAGKDSRGNRALQDGWNLYNQYN